MPVGMFYLLAYMVTRWREQRRELGPIVRELLLFFIVLLCQVIGRWISPVTSVSATVPVLRQTAWVWLH